MSSAPATSRRSSTLDVGNMSAEPAPWVRLLLLSTQPNAVQAYNTSAGTVVLLVGGGVPFAAYRAMLRIARLPSERRVLR